MENLYEMYLLKKLDWTIFIVNTILNPGNKMVLSSENVKGQKVNVLKT